MMEEETLLVHLECPVCFLIPRSPPIYQCFNGHLLCSECRPRLDKCPVCNIYYIQGLLLRNIFAEKVLEMVERRCRYELNDCTTYLNVQCTFKSRSSEALLEHEKECVFKPPGGGQEEVCNVMAWRGWGWMGIGAAILLAVVFSKRIERTLAKPKLDSYSSHLYHKLLETSTVDRIRNKIAFVMSGLCQKYPFSSTWWRDG